MTGTITPEGLARLDEALAYIDAHPEEHNQNVWFRRDSCGTTACLAGVLALLAGGKPAWFSLAPPAPHMAQHTAEVNTPDGRLRPVSNYAAELLGYDRENGTAQLLFYHAGDASELHRIRDQLAATLEKPEVTA